MVDKNSHPDRLRENEAEEKRGLARDISAGIQAREFFLLENPALGGDFAAGIIRPHEGEQDDLEHHNARDEAADLAGLDQKIPRLAELPRHIEVQPHTEICDSGQAVPCKDCNQQREAQDESELEENLRAAAGENQHSTLQKSEELAARAGQFHRRCGRFWRLLGGGIFCGIGGFLNGLLVFLPGSRPVGRFAEFKAFVKFVRRIHAEVVG